MHEEDIYAKQKHCDCKTGFTMRKGHKNHSKRGEVHENVFRDENNCITVVAKGKICQNVFFN